MKHLLLLLGWLLLAPSALVSVQAVESFPQDEQHRGVINTGNYQIFPENRLGNGLYFKQKLLFSFPERNLLDIAEIVPNKTLLYLYADAQSNLELGAFEADGSNHVKIKRVDDEFYEVWSVTANVARRVFRIYQRRLVGVFGHLRTLAGVTPGQDHVAFYHILEVKDREVNGRSQRMYSFRVHVLKRTAEAPRTLEAVVQNTAQQLQLSWSAAKVLRCTRADGTYQDFDLEQLMPDYL